MGDLPNATGVAAERLKRGQKSFGKLRVRNLVAEHAFQGQW